MKKNSGSILNNESGLIIADFLFSFVLVISCGIIIFLFTFSLATVEISEYIVWSTARNFSVANVSESDANIQATKKFNNLAAQFPALTGKGSQTGSSWFVLDGLKIGDLAKIDPNFTGKLSGGDLSNKDQGGYGERRQPWIGAKADLELKILTGIKIPLIGGIRVDAAKFKFPIRAFILRHPSQSECYEFYSKPNRFILGIQKLESQMNSVGSASSYVPMEDNGC
jgi:hypothetical protein